MRASRVANRRLVSPYNPNNPSNPNNVKNPNKVTRSSAGSHCPNSSRTLYFCVVSQRLAETGRHTYTHTHTHTHISADHGDWTDGFRALHTHTRHETGQEYFPAHQEGRCTVREPECAIGIFEYRRQDWCFPVPSVNIVQYVSAI